MEYVTLAEAASFLGVSKATLRNWDRAGKLRATRHPINQYRVYAISELRVLQSQLSLLPQSIDESASLPKLDLRSAKRLISCVRSHSMRLR